MSATLVRMGQISRVSAVASAATSTTAIRGRRRASASTGGGEAHQAGVEHDALAPALTVS